jgi:hypothetical protein
MATIFIGPFFFVSVSSLMRCDCTEISSELVTQFVDCRQTLRWDYFLLARQNEAAGAADAAA